MEGRVALREVRNARAKPEETDSTERSSRKQKTGDVEWSQSVAIS
jgi:hypothetical protein